MRKLLLAFLVLSNTATAQFQIEDIPSKRATVGAFANGSFDNLFVGVEGGILFPKHWLNLGVGIAPYYYSPLKNWGVNVNYNYFPNSYSHRFDLFFDFNYILDLKPQHSGYWDSSGFFHTNSSIAARNDFTIGIGFLTNFSSRFYLKTGIGAGLTLDISSGGFDPYFNANARISIGYRF